MTTTEAPLKWYHYRQNNSGGSFIGPVDVWVQATTPEQADKIATSKGPVYFDGCDNEMDCVCCGDRWFRASEYDAEDRPVYFQFKWQGADEDVVLTVPGFDPEQTYESYTLAIPAPWGALGEGHDVLIIPWGAE